MIEGDTHPALSGLRVLVVEDEMLVSMLIEDMLFDNHCTVVGPHERIGSAMMAAQSETFDFALLDINLDGVKAYPVAQVIADRGIPFLLLSGYGPAAIPAEHPDWQVCTKPFKVPVLLQMIVDRLDFPSSSRV